MNKPAPKEPSMDEILSSIRQIIADDDGPVPSQQDDPMAAAKLARPASEAPLSLSADQIVSRGSVEVPEDEPEADTEPGDAIEARTEIEDLADFADDDDDDLAAATEDTPPLFDPEDIDFASEAETAGAKPAAMPEPASKPAFAESMKAAPAQAGPERPSTAQFAPMPDPMLTSDIAEQLLEPATNAAVRANFARLNNLGLGNSGLTIEAMMREMLRPLLKEWLDEHLPAVVERMVEKEIGRISRGVE